MKRVVATKPTFFQNRWRSKKKRALFSKKKKTHRLMNPGSSSNFCGFCGHFSGHYTIQAQKHRNTPYFNKCSDQLRLILESGQITIFVARFTTTIKILWPGGSMLMTIRAFKHALG